MKHFVSSKVIRVAVLLAALSFLVVGASAPEDGFGNCCLARTAPVSMELTAHPVTTVVSDPGPTVPVPTDTSAFFLWLLNSGGLALVVSWVVERWPWYQKQSPDTKKVLFIAFVVLGGIIVKLLQTYVPATIWALIDPWFNTVTGLIVMASGAMSVHALTKPTENP